MIYCRRGWVRVVYEDQGPPFVMHEGDCVLQPPEIRHRVLEASPGMEVIEIGSPAEHETWRDHALELPTVPVQPLRDFGGQRFARHIAAEAGWQRSGDGRFEFRDCGIAQATAGLAAVRVLRAKLGAMSRIHTGEFLFFAVLDGRLRMLSKALGAHMLETDDTCVIPTGADFAIEAIAPCEVLEVALPAR
jgi:mannose-6-phosphate isomerase-like protein (cupin superfamily)